MESATWCRTPAAASAGRRLRSEVWKNSSTALSSNEGELARSITTCAPTRASLRPAPVMVLTPVLGEAARTSWPPWRSMGAVFEPISPVPPIATIFIANLLVRSRGLGLVMVARQAADALKLDSPECSARARARGGRHGRWRWNLLEDRRRDQDNHTDK